MRFDCMFSMLFHWEALCNLETDDNIAFSLEEKKNICICIFLSLWAFIQDGDLKKRREITHENRKKKKEKDR